MYVCIEANTTCTGQNIVVEGGERGDKPEESISNAEACFRLFNASSFNKVFILAL